MFNCPKKRLGNVEAGTLVILFSNYMDTFEDGIFQIIETMRYTSVPFAERCGKVFLYNINTASVHYRDENQQVVVLGKHEFKIMDGLRHRFMSKNEMLNSTYEEEEKSRLEKGENESGNFIIGIRFVTGHDNKKVYAFKSDIVVKEDDYVVVDTVNGFGVGRVMYIEEAKCSNKQSIATRWVICKVDIEAHNERIKKHREKKQIKEKLNCKLKKFREENELRLLLEHDEEARQLYEELESLR